MNENLNNTNHETIPVTQQEKQQNNRKMHTEKYLEDKYFPTKLKTDNVIKSTGHYLKKYYMPNSNCKSTKRFYISININIKYIF